MAGSGKQPPEVQARIRELLEAGFDPTTIHRKLKVGRSSIYRMKRCLQQYGSAYLPVELNKKNGRPKTLNAEQELEVREWLRDSKNRTRYLDDLVWLIHDRFNVVCSTTTMSKLKRKWLLVIEAEEAGQPLDEETRKLVAETHPLLSILQQQPPLSGTMTMSEPQRDEAHEFAVQQDHVSKPKRGFLDDDSPAYRQAEPPIDSRLLLSSPQIRGMVSDFQCAPPPPQQLTDAHLEHQFQCGVGAPE
ncbi:hypothetical protein BAUCODRAFT_27090 [Baudoinia panamericana UAMH 10762]|uniref:Uncharacterized protein n=1 Tax=Baudoinia panamericana (strain UAMH 10762) TaxID=717646 RepID=M2M8M0_BAUPA|nr:uncharacterized protein BAUCODRAFT_27090 [Baudoinia panamericana UAMH 10762]EMC92741.1 hypothetical protein BAUCODRAFT_27090 [Baudoinia panamericana UAMH 10762]